MARRKSNLKPTEADLAAGMMAWYEQSIGEHPEGLITQAQASKILQISRMSVSRLITRGYLHAVYYPKPPDVVGVAIGDDDPTWVKIVGWLGIKLGETEVYAWPTASYVSFADVKKLWQSGEARKKCARDWNEIMANVRDGPDRTARVRRIQQQHRERADMERRLEDKDGS